MNERIIDTIGKCQFNLPRYHPLDPIDSGITGN